MSFVPMTELPGRFRVDLPEEVSADRIGVNLERLDRIANVGCFAGDVSVSSFRTDRDDWEASVILEDGDSLVIASSSMIERPAVEHYFDPSYRLGTVHDHPWLGLGVNTTVAERCIREAGKRPDDVHAWSQQLNGAVSRGLRNATWEHLVTRPQYGELIMSAIPGIIGGGYFSERGIIINFISNNIIRGLIGTIIRRQKLSEICWSITPGVHPDRALLVAGMSRALPIFKPLKDKAIATT